MTELWALTASASEVDSADRNHLAREMGQWLDAGRDALVLTTCHRAELYGLGVAPHFGGPHVLKGDAGASITIASRDQSRASRLAAVYSGPGVSLERGAAMTGTAVAVAVALGGPWVELSTLADHDLPPIADISAPQAVPDAVRSRLNGGFLGIDDLYHHRGALPAAYRKDAEPMV